jgi:hypothetical protein
MRKAAYFFVGLLALSGPLSAGVFELGLNGGFFNQEGASGLCLGSTAGFTGLGLFSLEAGYSYYFSGSRYGGSVSEFGLSVLIGPKLKETKKPAPFLLFGASYFWELGSLETTLADAQFAVGVGLKLLVSKRIGFRFDGRYFIHLVENEYPHFRNLWRLTLGICFRL